MELAGDEKRIQALFSELRLEDQSIAPSFDRLWNSARITKPQRVALVQPLVMIGAFATLAVAVGLGLRSPEPAIDDIAHVSAPIGISSIEFPTEAPKKAAPGFRRTVHRRHVRPKKLDHVVIQQAEVLSSWQSPTSALMESAVAPVLSSLPELTESVKELESYLSNNEVKELKQ